MKLAYVGNFGLDYATEVHVARDAETLGIEVDRIQEPDSPYQHFEFLTKLERRADGADLLLYQKTWGLPDHATDLWRRVEARGTQTASYHLDLYVGLARQQLIARDPFWRTGTVFTADGDPDTAAYMEAFGVNHRWMPPAVVSDEAIPGTYRPELAHDVVFVGSIGAYHPEWPWRKELLSTLSRVYGDRFKMYGHGKPVRGLALNDLYASAKVIVGDSLALPGHTRYWSDRYYETVGRGGFLLAPRVPGIEEHFIDGEHLRLYEIGDMAGLLQSVSYYIDNHDEAKRIAKQGQEHLAEHHTYAHRVASMCDALGLAY